MAQGPSGPNSQSPFSVGEHQDVGLDVNENRARSYRVYAIVLGLFALVFAALCTGVGGLIYMQNNQPDATSPEPTVAASPKPKSQPTEDTAADVALPPPAPMPARPRPQPRPRPSGGTAPSPRPAPAPAPTTSPRDVTIVIPEGEFFTAAEITCNSPSFRGRGAFSGTSATVRNVPPGDCKVHFKGGKPATASISGGKTSYSCVFSSAVASCK